LVVFTLILWLKCLPILSTVKLFYLVSLFVVIILWGNILLQCNYPTLLVSPTSFNISGFLSKVLVWWLPEFW
jgi:hypothetical protein